MSETPVSPDHALMINQLSLIADISADERRALAALPIRVRAIAQDRDMVRQGDRPLES